MKSKWILFVLGFVILSNQEFQGQNSLLWKVTHIDSPGRVSYLFGTIHLQDSSLNCFSDELWNAIDACDLVAGELDLKDPSLMVGMMTKSMMKDTTLADLLNEEELESLRNLVSGTVDPFTWSFLQKMKPILLMGPLYLAVDSVPQFDLPMDMRIMNAGKKTVGLESLDEQLAALSSIPLQEQADMLMEVVQNLDSMRTVFLALKESYRAQDIEGLKRFIDQMEMDPSVSLDLIERRNQVMAERLIGLLELNSVFAAVGAGHLGGESGMINILRQKDFAVDPVSFHFQDKDCR